MNLLQGGKVNMEIYTTYKDRVFRLLFRDKKRILELYNALNETHYDNEEEFEQRLSAAFEDDSEGCIELKVRTININHGHNKELMERCRTLAEYAQFVAKIRDKLQSVLLEDAVKNAVEECIKEGILRTFLIEQKAEVIAMSSYEYNEEYARKAFFEE